MYTLLIVFFLVAPRSEGGVSVYSKEVAGIVSEEDCNSAKTKAVKDFSGNIQNSFTNDHYPSVVTIRTSCFKTK